MSQTNTPFNSGNNNAGFGIKEPEKLKELNTPEMKNKSIGYVMRLSKAKLTKKYTKNCEKGENPFPPVKIKKTPSKNPKPTKIKFSKPYDFPYGLVIPVYKKVYTPILIPKMRRPTCYKPEEPIKDKSAKYGEPCNNDSHCIKGYCHGAFLKIKKGTCKKKRKTKNVSEGEQCKVNTECKEGLICVNNWGGLKLGYCKSKKLKDN
jgi:hypothetical protein